MLFFHAVISRCLPELDAAFEDLEQMTSAQIENHGYRQAGDQSQVFCFFDVHQQKYGSFSAVSAGRSNLPGRREEPVPRLSAVAQLLSYNSIVSRENFRYFEGVSFRRSHETQRRFVKSGLSWQAIVIEDLQV